MPLFQRRILTPYEQYLQFSLSSLRPCINRNNTPCSHSNCNHTCIQNGYCIECLNDILTNDNSRISRLRNYSCDNITYSYVLRYLNRYASEIYKLFIKTKFIYQPVINMISLGCGPATELIGFEAIYHQVNPTGMLNYLGFDTNNIWNNCQNALVNIFNSNSYVTCQFPNQILLPDNPIIHKTNLFVLNYVLSHIHKHVDSDDIYFRNKAVTDFLDNVVSPIFDGLPSNSILLINDTNSYYLGRNQIEYWARNQSQKASSLVMGIYPNQSKPFAKFNHTNTIMNDVSLIFQKNSPYDKFQISIDSCGSAFVLIKKR